ncbi:hypothetical protein QUF58_08880, partial [Anaerolineales bacterium HSG24]|nr:hypothetical protein [Anaerolineales bacterium HSG24]
MGLYELKQQPKYNEDWIMMLDATIELGDLKCLGILGIPMSRLSDTGYALKHLDVDVLELVVLSSCRLWSSFRPVTIKIHGCLRRLVMVCPSSLSSLTTMEIRLAIQAT